MLKYLHVVLFWCIAGLSSVAATLPATLDDALSLLKETLGENQKLTEANVNKIDSIRKAIKPGAPNEVALLEEIAVKYRLVNVDSALHYFGKAQSVAAARGDSASVSRMMLYRAASLPVKGACIEAVEAFDSVNPANFTPQERLFYLRSGHDLFFYLASTYPMFDRQMAYAKRGSEMTQALISSLPASDPWRKLYEVEMCFLRKDFAMVAALAQELLESQPLNSHIFALASSIYANYLRFDPERKDDELYYRVLSAVSDLLDGNREEESLHLVGMDLFERGDIDLAYECMSQSLDNAIQSGSRIRSMRTAEIIPMIAGAYREQNQRKLLIITWTVIGLLALLCIIGGILLFLRKEMRNEARLKKSLKESNMLKESFINQFLSLCSIYMEKLDEFNRLSARKIKAGQIEDLYNTIKSGKMLDEQKDLFCEIFDRAFTKIYPSFVTEVNALLQPDKQVVVREDGALNTELRILAFMRLGLDDSAKIARFLNLSVNTIYTYRNKLKGKAVARETFEQSVMKIAVID